MPKQEVTQEDILQSVLSHPTATENKIPQEAPTPQLIEHKNTIYGLGGAGIKICAKIPSLTELYNVVTIDTSRSEDALLPMDSINRIYLSSDIDGSGAVRSANYDLLVKAIPDVMDSTNASEINYVVFSASGASGSTASYIVIDELLKRGKSVIAIMSINADNELRVKNTVSTILSLHELTQKHKCNIPVYMAQQESLAVQDNLTAAFIRASSALINPGILGIDDTDRKNFLSPSFIPSIKVKPSLLSLSFAIGDGDSDDSDITSALVLTEVGGSDKLKQDSKVTFAGLMDSHIAAYLGEILNNDKLSSDNTIASLVTRFLPPYMLLRDMQDAADEYEKKTTLQNTQNQRIMSGIRSNGDGGIVL